ncbi:HAMP domain-containing protein [Roseomonas stagni]|uniref:HAMP domain-containing protein n=1 Tax=Falsiroseomonas algicola TaxID=2716930 RepID=A0A6M1LFA3_9PROT|nr:methyl-accepting chemotaxis protein [Falsiroseomonas algicola]NGM18930.1 HAMP domain-containing protein [Falsiroseomonas algicola]
MQLPTFLRGLRPRLVMLATMPALAAVLMVAGYQAWSDMTERTREAAEQLDRSVARIENELADTTRRVLGHAVNLSLRPDLAAVLQAGDHAASRAMLMEVYEALHAVDPAVRVVEATDARAKTLFRSYDPPRWGDDKSRDRDVAAALAGRNDTGLTLSRASGAIAINAVIPVRLGGRADGPLVGTIRVASRLLPENAVALSRLAGVQVVLIGGDKLIGASVPGVTMDMLADAIADPPASHIALPGLGDHRLRMMPLADPAGRAVGRILLAQSTAALEAARAAALNLALIVVGLVMLVTLPLGLLAARTLARPLAALGEAMRVVAAGTVDLAIPGRDRADEIGAMARALEVFRDQARDKAALEATSAAERAARERRAQELERQTRDFSAALAGVMQGLSGSAARMDHAAGSMAGSAITAEEQAEATADSAQASTRDLDSVAEATHEMTASVTEIGRQAGTAARMAAALVDRTRRADATMARLSDAARMISDVARLISDIAGQTNLLALNATIEAARAGEAGKGFAVVANEVKALASQTAKATEEISGQIQAIQSAAEEAVATVRGMATEVGGMGDSATAIAAAVDQQGEATRQIAASVATVLQSARHTVEAMAQARQTARDVRETSSEVQAAAVAVTRETETLGTEITHFMAMMRQDGSERRQFERILADGRAADIGLPGGEVFPVRLLDASRGGMGVEGSGPMPASLRAGLSVTVTLPGEGAIAARVAHLAWPRLGLVVAQAEAQARMESVMDSVRRKAA